MEDINKNITKTHLIWKISNINQETLKNGIFIRSNTFKTIIGDDEIKWSLKFQCFDNKVGIYWQRRSFDTDDFMVHFMLDVCDSKDQFKKSYKFERNLSEFTKNNYSWGWTFATFERILNIQNSSLYKENTLKFTATLTLNKIREKIKMPEPSEHLRNYAKYINSREFSDFTCISSDGKRFPIHRNILAAQSPVFEKMLKTNMSKNKSKTIRIKDVDGDTFLELLKFIYTREVENLKNVASSLIYAAEKYEINELKKLCTESLIENLSVDNALETLILADRFNEKTLLFECLQFIIKNFHVISNKDWKQTDSKLMLKVMKAIEKNYKKQIKSSPEENNLKFTVLFLGNKTLERSEKLRNYTKLLNSNDFSDFTCISSDGKEFPIHCCILAAESPVFEKMLKADMSENKSKIVKIEDVDGDTFLELLRFIYTKEVENLKNVASSLIYAAEKYEINELKKLCTESLIENLTVDNALETLVLADRFNEKTLLCECLQFIINNFDAINDEDWERIDSKLMLKMMKAIEKKYEKIIELQDSL
ncbi:hypothetical protein PVAND_001547 [Polypedilum vanderplanki]|uniref:BTB domain-containing protein n=1 Tax=Polypedilum vanderplanki TaxID=319348 RepID=A0A9J6BNR1_POLVA|nr:hypothetical protein PVAND_001547 [Polypedilum vanderplanki]